MITQEEQDIVHHFVLLTIARKALEMDVRSIEASSLKMKEAYLRLILQLLDDVSKELAVLKRFMQQRQLKITSTANDGTFTQYSYVCRGFHDTRHYLNAHLKNIVHSYIHANLQRKKHPTTYKSG